MPGYEEMENGGKKGSDNDQKIDGFSEKRRGRGTLGKRRKTRTER